MSAAALILLYHRVADECFDPQLLCVSPAHFAAQLDWLRNNASVLPLETLVRLALDDMAPPDAVAITFDDGYADNLTNAAPLLARAALPATIFVASGGVERAAPFWWDWLAEDIRPSAREAAWDVLAGPPPTPRHARYLDRLARLRGLRGADRDAALATMAPLATPPARVVSPDELRRLAAQPGIDIGAHTVSHACLAALPPHAQQLEIAGSREQLEAWLGAPPRAFAYPFGTRRDFDDHCVRCTREAGFTHACANFPGRVRPDCDPFRLPRMIVRDWDVENFAAHVEVQRGAR